MSNESIYISDHEIERLIKLPVVEKAVNSNGEDGPGLEAELGQVRIIASRDVPQDLVSRIFQVCLVDPDTGEEICCSLIFPDEADLEQHKISVLARIIKGVIQLSCKHS